MLKKKKICWAIAIIYWTQLTEIHTNFFFYCVHSAVHIFDICHEAAHLLENNQLLYSLYCSLLTPTYWLSFRYIFKTSPCQSVFKLITISLKNKTCRTTLALTMPTVKSELTLSGRWKILCLLLKIPKYMPHTFVLCTNDSFTHFFLTLRLDPPKGQSLFLFSANPSSPTKKCGTFGPSVPERGLSLGNSSMFVWIDVHGVDRLKTIASQSFP